MEVINADLIPIDDMVFRCIRPKQITKNIEKEEKPPARKFFIKEVQNYFLTLFNFYNLLILIFLKIEMPV